MDRKPRSDSKLKLTPEPVQAGIGAALAEPGYTLDAAVDAWAAAGVATSRTAVQEWYRWWRLQRRADAAQAHATEMLERLAREGIDTTGMETAGDCIFMSEALEKGDEKAYYLIRSTMLKKQALEHDGEKLRLRIREMEEKSRAAKAALEVVKKEGGITEETLKRIEEAASLL
jgi:hypothetical protein